MTPKPTAYLIMHCTHGIVCWCEIENDEFMIIRRYPEQYRIYDINSQTARIFVATEDNDLTKQDALKTASCFVRGAYIRTDVNLDRGESHTQMGKPLVHPPH